MNPEDIYSKTNKGQAEIRSRSGNLSMLQRRLLILVDGRRSCREIWRITKVDDYQKMFYELAAAGYIAGYTDNGDIKSDSRTAPTALSSTPTGIAEEPDEESPSGVSPLSSHEISVDDFMEEDSEQHSEQHTDSVEPPSVNYGTTSELDVAEKPELEAESDPAAAPESIQDSEQEALSSATDSASHDISADKTQPAKEFMLTTLNKHGDRRNHAELIDQISAVEQMEELEQLMDQWFYGIAENPNNLALVDGLNTQLMDILRS